MTCNKMAQMKTARSVLYLILRKPPLSVVVMVWELHQELSPSPPNGAFFYNAFFVEFLAKVQ